MSTTDADTPVGDDDSDDERPAGNVKRPARTRARSTRHDNNDDNDDDDDQSFATATGSQDEDASGSEDDAQGWSKHDSDVDGHVKNRTANLCMYDLVNGFYRAI